MVNCILWNGGNEIWNNDGSTIAIDYSDVHGGYTGTGNFSADPLFVDASKRDYHLTALSPCIDKGDDTRSQGTTDYDGNPRIADARVDVGADEFYPHLYYTGSASPGATARVNIIGRGGAQAAWGASAFALPSPIRLSGPRLKSLCAS